MGSTPDRADVNNAAMFPPEVARPVCQPVAGKQK
jgi:hypothetical protein